MIVIIYLLSDNFKQSRHVHQFLIEVQCFGNQNDLDNNTHLKDYFFILHFQAENPIYAGPTSTIQNPIYVES